GKHIEQSPRILPELSYLFLDHGLQRQFGSVAWRLARLLDSRLKPIQAVGSPNQRAQKERTPTGLLGYVLGQLARLGLRAFQQRPGQLSSLALVELAHFDVADVRVWRGRRPNVQELSEGRIAALVLRSVGEHQHGGRRAGWPHQASEKHDAI